MNKPKFFVGDKVVVLRTTEFKCAENTIYLTAGTLGKVTNVYKDVVCIDGKYWFNEKELALYNPKDEYSVGDKVMLIDNGELSDLQRKYAGKIGEVVKGFFKDESVYIVKFEDGKGISLKREKVLKIEKENVDMSLTMREAQIAAINGKLIRPVGSRLKIKFDGTQFLFQTPSKTWELVECSFDDHKNEPWEIIKDTPKFKVGDIVYDQYGDIGIIKEIRDNLLYNVQFDKNEEYEIYSEINLEKMQ